MWRTRVEQDYSMLLFKPYWATEQHPTIDHTQCCTIHTSWLVLRSWCSEKWDTRHNFLSILFPEFWSCLNRSPLEALQPRKIYSSVQTQSLWNSWIQNYPSHAWEALRAPAVQLFQISFVNNIQHLGALCSDALQIEQVRNYSNYLHICVKICMKTGSFLIW